MDRKSNFPLVCPRCGADMRVIAFITAGPTVRDILGHLGEPTTPPRIAPARARPQVPREALGAARCRRKSTLDPPYQLLHTQPRALEMTIR